MILTVAKEDYIVEYVDSPKPIDDALMAEKPQFFTYDTETTGLHLKADRPFLGAICFNNRVFVFPTVPEILSWLVVWSKCVKRVYAHNCTYDMHMTANIMGDRFPLEIKNWGDTMCLARLSFESQSADKGGDSIALKAIGRKYIDATSDRWEKSVKAWLQAKETADKKVLSAFLNGIKDDKGRKWSLTRLTNALNKGSEVIPQDVLDVYQSWRHTYPLPTYQDVPMEIMMPYVAVDVILTKILVRMALPVVVQREQVETMNREFKLMPVVYKMERRGIRVDREYLEKSNYKLEQYIKTLYVKMHVVAGLPVEYNEDGELMKQITANGRKKLMELYTDLLGKEPESLDKQFMGKMARQGDELAPIISRLRRLEKWKKNYVEKILDRSEHDGRYYTSLNQFNPVSGRFSGDSQQFPKDPIYTEEGYAHEKENPGHKVPDEYILYHPRRAFLGRIYYLDYSQVELRVQGHFTLYFGGDVNLCRAYMPYRCVHYRTGEPYNHETVEGRNRWNELREGAPSGLHWEDALADKWSVWQVPDTGETWVPTDVHTATTLKALVVMGYNPAEMDLKDIAWWRKKGKTFNFMRNYGGGDAKAAETLEIELYQAKALNQGYTVAFPVVVTYQNGVITTARQRGYVINLYSRRYYLSNWNKHYTLGNHLIQGTCADMLKEKMIIVDAYIVEHDLEDKLGMVLCVHDELQFEEYTDEDMSKHIWAIKAIMEDAPDVKVPIVAEVEKTETNWASKKKIQMEVAA